MTYDFSERFWSKVPERNEGTCWAWAGSTDTNGYGHLSVGGRRGRMFAAHRLSYWLAFGDIPDGGHILHSCDNRTCVNPSHLRLGDHDENMRDMASRERSRTTKLTAAQVIEIRSLASTGVPQRELARRYGVRQGNIHAILSRQTWKHVA